ncbi:MAG: hypothetical protein QM655_03745 [Nocardioidaceae bacterium]
MSRYLLSAVGAVLLVVLGVFLTPGTTGALWSGRTDLGAGTIDSGSLSLLVGDAGTQSTAYAFTALAAGNLGPGGYGQAPLTIGNSGSAALQYRLNSWTAVSAALAHSLTLTATSVPSTAACPAASATTTEAGSAQPGTAVDVSAFRSLASTATEVLCLRYTLNSDTSAAAVAGAASPLTLTWYAEQDPR